MVMRVWASLAGGGVCGLDAGAGEFWASTPWENVKHAAMQRPARNFVVKVINRRTTWSTERQAGSSLAALSLAAAYPGGAAPPLHCRRNPKHRPFGSLRIFADTSQYSAR